MRLDRRRLFLLIIITLPIIVRVLNYDLGRIHGDDLLTAYFSAHYNLLKDNFFAPIPLDKAQWVSQFPSLFFALQKIFFLIFSESLLTIKLSILPYVLIVSIMLFLISKIIFEEKTATISVIIYSFLAISLYHETLGLHFISSTALFMVFFYLLILNLKKPDIYLTILVGFFAGLSYLFYSSSYIAVPILIIVSSIYSLFKRKKIHLLNMIKSLVICLITLSPFIYNMVKNNNFYLKGRIDQVNLLWGEWSSEAVKIKNGENPALIIKQNFIDSIKSLYVDGIGGHGGYDFRHLAFFDKFTLVLFIFGLLLCLKLLIKKPELILTLAIILTSFIFGIVMTIPPPAYHRFSLAFPFIAIILSVPFYFLLKSKFANKVKYLSIILLLLFYIWSNESHFLKASGREKNNSSLRLANYINTNFPGRNIYVASFPGFAFEKIYYFSPNKKTNNIITNYHINFLNNFNSNEKYVYVIIFPDSFDKKFKQIDSKGRIIQFSESYSLFVN